MKGEVRVRIAMGVMCSALVLAGCAAETAGEAAPQGTVAGEPVFSPCDDIPDEAIVAIGMDPATEERDIMDVRQPGWNLCSWRNGDLSLSVYSTVHTLDDLRADTDFTGFAVASVPGRDAVTFRSVDTAASTRSYVAVGTDEGMVMLSFSDWAADGSRPAPGDRAMAAMTALLQHIPN